MKIFKAISTEKGNEGKVLGTSKVTTMVNGKLTTSFITKEELSNKIYNSFVDSFEIITIEI